MVSKFAIFESVAVAMIVVVVLMVGCTDPPTPPIPTPDLADQLSLCIDGCEWLYADTARYLPCVSTCVNEYKELGGE